MEYLSEKCPNCGANEINSNMVCNFCGSKLVKKEQTIIIVNKGYRCPLCHTDNQENNDFCQQCGSSIKKKCHFCHEKHYINISFCPKSGYSLKETEEKPLIEEKKKKNQKHRVDIKKILNKAIDMERESSS